jgi:hypothetical protein
VLTLGVLSDPASVFSLLVARLTGRFKRSEGYLVDARAALAILESAHPEAAAWWKAHAPHFLRPRRIFLFHKSVGSVVEQGAVAPGNR